MPLELLDLGLLLCGGVLLYYGAEWLVTSASGIARWFGVSPLVIGLTVVSYGTSAPELVVSVVASLRGSSALVLGNVVGSNIANTGLILGATALIAPPLVDRLLVRRELPCLLLATAAIPAFLLDGSISRFEGLLLLGGALLFTLATFCWTKSGDRASAAQEAEEQDGAGASKWRLVVGLLGGLGGLVLGGELFVRSASSIALAIGMSERQVGLTIVALGTSLPELAASVMAATRGHSDIAVGNVIGSNVFNLLLILGTASTVVPLSAMLSTIAPDLIALGLLSLLMTFSMRTARRITRAEGTIYVVSYFAFMVLLNLR